MSTRSKSAEAAKARKEFGETLAKLRQLRGHESAYGLYHGSGAQEFFQFSYNHYLMIESGQRLPSVDALKKIIEALFGKSKKSMLPEKRELCRAYLWAMGEGESIFDLVWDTPEEKGSVTAEDGMLKEMARRRVGEVPRLSQEQTQVVFNSPLTFWCHQMLLQSGRLLKAQDLAATLKASVTQVEEALELLQKAGIVEKSKAQKYRSKFWETDVFLPPPNFIQHHSPWLSRQIDEVRTQRPSGESGGNHGYFFLTLESEKEFEQLSEQFRETMRKAYLYRRKGPFKGKAVLCSAEWRFFRLFDLESE